MHLFTLLGRGDEKEGESQLDWQAKVQLKGKQYAK